jgi:hypothetical protein
VAYVAFWEQVLKRVIVWVAVEVVYEDWHLLEA